MYISRLVVQNFRNFRLFDSRLGPGVTTIIGENNSGKTNLLYAIRLAIDASLSSYRRRLLPEDFAAGLDLAAPQQILVSIEFSDFKDQPNQEAWLLDCLVGEETARITYRFRPRRPAREALVEAAAGGEEIKLSLDDYHWEICGGGDVDPVAAQWNDDFGQSIRFEQLQQAYEVVTLDALRDARELLAMTRRSPLSRLVTAEEIPEEEREGLVGIVRDANRRIADSPSIQEISAEIKDSLDRTAGEIFTFGVGLGMSFPSFDDITRGLTLLLSNNALSNFSPERNGLGLNNVLYISLVLQYFEKRVQEAKTAGQVLLIEEPEAHVHPQLQRVLFNTLCERGLQVLLTTHSTHISSQTPLASTILLTNAGIPATASVSLHAQDFLSERNIQDLERYLDATRGTLLYARRVLLVEGPAELFLVPPLVRQVLGRDLDALGISVVPIFGVHFDAYAGLFGEGRLPKKCAILADGDQMPSDADPSATLVDLPELPRPNLEALQNDHVQTFVCTTTFERELAHEGTLEMFALAAQEIGVPRVASRLRGLNHRIQAATVPTERETLVGEAGEIVLAVAKRIGKARFAQVASKHVSVATWVPLYLRNAIEWLTRD
jgi:putative ATP-dependent endonuclease of OLD family